MYNIIAMGKGGIAPTFFHFLCKGFNCGVRLEKEGRGKNFDDIFYFNQYPTTKPTMPNAHLV
ncbi:MAG: hypothetical protein KC643_33585 [Nitrospira sp.]|nr:hypothetical protein [Nitrospira sp.]